MIPRDKIGARVIQQSLMTYDRGFDIHANPEDAFLLDDIERRGILTPVILFLDREGTLNLVSGGRRLAAFDQIHADSKKRLVPCVVAQENMDTLTDALMAEWAEQEKDPTGVKPMTWREKLLLGTVVRGWQAYHRKSHRLANGTVTFCTKPVEDYGDFLSLTPPAWRSLKALQSQFIVYEGRPTITHDPALAKQLLDQLDAGEITVHQARNRYVARNVTAPVPPRPRKEWIEHAPRLTSSLRQLTQALRDYESIPPDIDKTLISTMQGDLHAVRTRIQILITNINKHLGTHKEETHED